MIIKALHRHLSRTNYLIDPSSWVHANFPFPLLYTTPQLGHSWLIHACSLLLDTWIHFFILPKIIICDMAYLTLTESLGGVGLIIPDFRAKKLRITKRHMVCLDSCKSGVA